MVKELHVMEKKRSVWSRSRLPCCSWMMTVTNSDLLIAATDHELEMLTTCTHTGAWQDHTDSAGNTALHLCVSSCMTNEDSRAEAHRLGLTIEEGVNLIDVHLKTNMKLNTRESRKALQEEINTRHEGLVNDLACVDILCEGFADPNATNAAGETCFDLAKDKNPSIHARLEQQVEYLAEVAAAAEEEE